VTSEAGARWPIIFSLWKKEIFFWQFFFTLHKFSFV
jgi:hypothetical protein